MSYRHSISEELALILRLMMRSFLIGMMMLAAGAVSGQNYPDRAVRIVTSDLGGGNDFVARVLAPLLSSSVGQPVIVENRKTIIAIETAAKAVPDGYTLLCAGSPLWLGPLMQKLSYDPVRDFSTITLVVRAPNILVVHPSMPASTVKDLISLAKGKPGEISYASGPTGAANHLAAELFKSMAGVNITRIPYPSGPGRAVIDLLSAQVQMMFVTVASVDQHIKSGRLRALAVTSAERSALIPGLTTVSEAGLPGFEASSFFGMFAPARTSMVIVRRLNQEFVRILGRAEVKEKFFNNGLEVAPSSPEQFIGTIKSEIVKMGKVIKDAGIRVD